MAVVVIFAAVAVAEVVISVGRLAAVVVVFVAVAESSLCCQSYFVGKNNCSSI